MQQQWRLDEQWRRLLLLLANKLQLSQGDSSDVPGTPIAVAYVFHVYCITWWRILQLRLYGVILGYCYITTRVDAEFYLTKPQLQNNLVWCGQGLRPHTDLWGHYLHLFLSQKLNTSVCTQRVSTHLIIISVHLGGWATLWGCEDPLSFSELQTLPDFPTTQGWVENDRLIFGVTSPFKTWRFGRYRYGCLPTWTQPQLEKLTWKQLVHYSVWGEDKRQDKGSQVDESE